jgi:squalene-associated FAD-dependent desaturase
MRKVIVAGGGFAGLAAASFITEKKIPVEVIESSPKLGGRAFSFTLKDQGTLDNAQHIMMGCYKETLKFLKLIGADEKLWKPTKLKVPFVQNDKSVVVLSSPPLPYPFDLLIGLLKFKAVSFVERVNILRFISRIKFYNEAELKKITVEDLLIHEKQTENIQKSLWEILCIGAMNTSTKQASANIFVKILKEIFFNGSFASTIIIPKIGLSELYCEPAKKYIENFGGKISLSEKIEELIIEDNIVTRLKTNKRTLNDIDSLILAIPPYALTKINGYEKILDRRMDELKFSSILTFHLWLNNNPLKEKFYGLINSPLHWVFNHQDHITTVISNANKIIEKPDEVLFDLVLCEINKFFGLEKDSVINYKMLKEKRATFIPDNESTLNRPETRTRIKNVFLAGDWISTGLPATIESAVLSGRYAANYLMDYNCSVCI